MTAQIIDFEEAKAKILGVSTAQETAAVSADLSSALEQFSFSRLPKLDRVIRIVAKASEYSGAGLTQEQVLLLAAQIDNGVRKDDFLLPLVRREA